MELWMVSVAKKNRKRRRERRRERESDEADGQKQGVDSRDRAKLDCIWLVDVRAT